MTNKAGRRMAKPVRTYSVSVEGYGSVDYCARSPAKARWRAYQDFGVVSECSFSEFLARSSIRRVENAPGVGDTILVNGKPATRVRLGERTGIYYMHDDSDVIYTAHETEVKLSAIAAAPVTDCP